jgi:hypothetical protein
MSANFYDTYGSYTVNGQIMPVFEAYGLYPSNAPAPYYMGNGAKPPTLAFSAQGGGADVASLGLGGDDAVQLAIENPFSMQFSPTLWAVFFLLIGMWGLRYVHWRG